MALTAEQKALIDSINGHVAAIREAAKRSFPGNKGFHDEFKVGAPAATTPAEAISDGKFVAPLVKEYRAMLFHKGIDQAKANHLAALVASLEKTLGATPPAPAVAPSVAEEPTAKAKKKKAKGKEA